jgi:hypothetical protein
MLMITVFASLASANDVFQDSKIPEMIQAPNWIADRVGMINDGSFEDGLCGAGSAWTCASTGTCPIIYDLSTIGLWNYDGDHTAWLGNVCSGIPDLAESVCQDVYFDGDLLAWYWMVFLSTDGDRIQVTVDGNVVYEYWTNLTDHLAGYVQQSAGVSGYVGGTHTLCFNYDLIASGGNYFLDYVTLDASVATEERSFSTVKSLY